MPNELDNTSTAAVDSASAQATPQQQVAFDAGVAGKIDPNRGWKESIKTPDLRNSLSKFDDTPDGIGKLAWRVITTLEQLLYCDKVPWIPKDINNDVEGWESFKQSFGST